MECKPNTLSHQESDRDLNKRSQWWTWQNVLVYASIPGFLFERCEKHTSVLQLHVRRYKRLPLDSTRWRHGRSWGETKYSWCTHDHDKGVGVSSCLEEGGYGIFFAKKIDPLIWKLCPTLRNQMAAFENGAMDSVQWCQCVLYSICYACLLEFDLIAGINQVIRSSE